MLPQLKARLPHDEGCQCRDMPGLDEGVYCGCTRAVLLESVAELIRVAKEASSELRAQADHIDIALGDTHD